MENICWMFESPILVFWEMTKACELSCIHCRASSITERSPDELTTEEAKRFIDGLAALSPRPVLIFTGGNPMIRDDIFELVSYAASKGVIPAVAPAVSPRLNKASLKRLKDAGAKYISISLDGAAAGTHEAIRRAYGIYKATLDAISDALSVGLEVQVNTAVMRPNLLELPDIFHLIRSLGVRTWEVFFLVVTGRAKVELDLTSQEYEAACNFLYDASRYDVTVRTVECPFIRRVLIERESGKAPPAGLYESLRRRLVELEGEPRGKSTIRPAGTLDGDGVIFVASNGNIYPSGFIELALGNVKRDSLIEVYRRSELLNKIRRRELNGPCGACPYKLSCGGSRSRAYFYFGDPLGSDPACILVNA